MLYEGQVSSCDGAACPQIGVVIWITRDPHHGISRYSVVLFF